MIEVLLRRETKPPRNLLLGQMSWPDVADLERGGMAAGASRVTLEDALVLVSPTLGYRQIDNCVMDGKTSIKVRGWTAINAGRYHMRLTHSTRFKRYLPELLDVPGFTGVRIHAGDTVADTSGCILLGEAYKPGDMVNSAASVDLFCRWLAVAERIDEVWISVVNP